MREKTLANAGGVRYKYAGMKLSIELNNEQLKTLTIVKDYLSKKMGSPMSYVAVYRFLATDFAKKQRLEGNDAENNTGLGSKTDS
jgi:hypothetical protein